MSENRSRTSEDFRAWVPDFDDWPRSWMGLSEDLAYGRRLLPYFSDFLQALHAEGMSRKTFTQYRDNLWLLGGTIIRNVSLYEEYQDDPLEKLIELVANDGNLPEHFDRMSQAELRAFERMCRRFENFFGYRPGNREGQSC